MASAATAVEERAVVAMVVVVMAGVRVVARVEGEMVAAWEEEKAMAAKVAVREVVATEVVMAVEAMVVVTVVVAR